MLIAAALISLATRLSKQEPQINVAEIGDPCKYCNQNKSESISPPLCFYSVPVECHTDSDCAKYSPKPSNNPNRCGGRDEFCCAKNKCDSGLYCSPIDGGTCFPRVCTSGARQYSGKFEQVCKKDGSGWQNTSCKIGCSNGRCQVCPPGNSLCQGQNLKQCKSDGSGYTTVQVCANNQTCNQQLG